MICLDFYGLPGSGKSTISHLVAKKLRENYKVREVSYEIDFGYAALIRGIIKLRYVLMLMINRPSCFFKLIGLIYNCGNYPLGKGFIKNLLNIAYKIKALQKESDTILIFDHGLWQTVLSLHYQQMDADYRGTYQQLLSLIPNDVEFLNVFLKLDPDNAVIRMKERTTDKARLEYLCQEEMMQELVNEVGILENYPNHDLIVDARLSKEDCCNIIINNLNEKGCFTELSRR